MRNLGLFMTGVVLISLLLTACGGQKETPAPASPSTPSAINAIKIYSTNCSACHGAKREGVSGLGKELTPESLAALSDAEVKTVISNGRPNTAMAPWQGILKPEEIDALVQLIKHTSP